MSNDGCDLNKNWDLWEDCLIGDDQNSIFRQIYTMNWDYAIFKVINEGRKIQVEKNPKDPRLNAPIQSLMDRAFLDHQCAAIRRVVDESRFGLEDENKGVFSLIALIKNIELHWLELTREKYLEMRGKPYDYSEIKRKYDDFFRVEAQKGAGAFSVPKELDWESIEEVHKQFDRISKTNKDARKPDDVISEDKLHELIEKLENCKEITKYVDKFIAHSATPESRKAEGAEDISITLKKVLQAQQDIYSVAEWISILLFGEGHMPLIWENPKFYDYLDVPLVDNDFEIERLRKVFEDFRKQTNDWMGLADKLIK